MGSMDWKRLDEQRVLDASIFSISKVRARSGRSGREHDFDVLEAPDWVNVVALTDAGRAVLIRQYRHGTREVTVEIPGGQVDPGETPLEAARRELAEETGYRSDHWEQIGEVDPNPAFQTNTTYTFLARGARPTGGQDLDDNEEIEVEELPLDQVPALFASGRIRHALVTCAFFHLALRGGLALGGG